MRQVWKCPRGHLNSFVVTEDSPDINYADDRRITLRGVRNRLRLRHVEVRRIEYDDEPFL
jgi:hypothetical protein